MWWYALYILGGCLIAVVLLVVLLFVVFFILAMVLDALSKKHNFDVNDLWEL